MSKEIEIEYKTLLQEDDFHRLKSLYFTDNETAFQQTNHYFDTTDFALKRLGAGLRIRVRAQHDAELTLKSPLKDQSGLLETTDMLSPIQLISAQEDPTSWPKGEVMKLLAEYQISPDLLERKAQLTTSRLEKIIAPGILLVLDESWYHGKHDFELEMEVTDAETGYAFFCHFLETHQLTLTKSPNKIARAVMANHMK